VADIRAFCGWRYNPQRYGSQYDTLIAPPYDVLSAADKQALLDRNSHNIVAIDLPHVPPDSEGPEACYREAARRLRSWQDEAVLVRDPQPALYVYHQEYELNGQRLTRKGFFAAMRLEAFGTGTVFPHEETFGGPKADRLKLMRVTQCQLSPVFGLYSDPEQHVAELLDVSSRPADIEANLGDVLHRVWVVQEPAVVAAVTKQMSSRRVYIADGHHRYGTALNYRDLLSRETPLPADHPAQFVLIGLCAMEDPGTAILPTHRVLSAFGELTSEHVVKALEAGLELKPLSDRPDNLETGPPPDSPDDLWVYVGEEDRFLAGRFTHRSKLDQLAPDKSPTWRNLDLAYVHRYLIDELIANDLMGGIRPTIRYFKRASEAVRTARQDHGIAMLCKPCTMAQLREVSEAGDLMPQKSTFFYPKLATGLVIRDLA